MLYPDRSGKTKMVAESGYALTAFTAGRLGVVSYVEILLYFLFLFNPRRVLLCLGDSASSLLHWQSTRAGFSCAC